MKLETSNPGIIKDIIETISSIIDECKLNITPDGITIHALDKSHITFVELDMKKTLFDEYTCETPEQVLIDTNQLMQILRRCKNDDILKIETEPTHITLNFDGESNRRFRVSLIDNEYESPQPPIIDYPVQITTPSTLIKDSLGDSKLFGENIIFTVDQDYLHICSQTASGVFGETHIKYLHGENINEVVKSGYSIEMLMNIFKASKISKECQLKLGDDIPLMVTFELPMRDGYLRFLLAPRLSED